MITRRVNRYDFSPHPTNKYIKTLHKSKQSGVSRE